MLTLRGGQMEYLWDEVLPIDVSELPRILARVDQVLCDPALLEPIAVAWGSRRAGQAGPMASFVVSCC